MPCQAVDKGAFLRARRSVRLRKQPKRFSITREARVGVLVFRRHNPRQLQYCQAAWVMLAFDFLRSLMMRFFRFPILLALPALFSSVKTALAAAPSRSFSQIVRDPEAFWHFLSTTALRAFLILLFFGGIALFLRILYGPKGIFRDPKWDEWNAEARREKPDDPAGKEDRNGD